MKKYNKPEIVTLALDMVDVIETSAEELAADLLTGVDEKNITIIEQQVTAMQDKWTW